MIKNFKFQILNSEKGVSLIITFFVMIIILAIVLSISALLYSEVKVIRNIGSSVASFYAAESGIEKVLFYDRQLAPAGAKRGLCVISASDSQDSCSGDPSPSATLADHSIYCNSMQATGDDCNPDTCTSCVVSFNTTFDDRTYFAKAIVSPSTIAGKSNLMVESMGTFGGAGRQIQITYENKENSNGPPASYTVSGAGNQATNGIYNYAGTNGGKGYYQKDTHTIFWDSVDIVWKMCSSELSCEGGCPDYGNDGGGDSPPLAGWFGGGCHQGALDPAPELQ